MELPEIATHAPDLATAISALAGGVGLHFLLKLVNFAWNLVKALRENDLKKVNHLSDSMEEINKTMQDNTVAINSLNREIKILSDRIVETDKVTILQEMSHERLVAVVREMAGDQWTEIQEKIRKDEFITKGEKR